MSNASEKKKSTSPYIMECKAELLKAIRTPQFSLPTIAFPLVFFLVFGVILAGENGTDRTLYLLATFGAFGAIGPALFGFGVNVAVERNNGWLDLKKISPMPISAYIAAKLFMTAVFGFIVITLLSAIAILFAGLSLSFQTWALMTVTQLMCAVPFALLGMTIGFKLSPDAAPATVNILFMLMSVFGGLWLPITLFPAALQNFAWLLPTFHSGQLSLASVGIIQNVPIVTHITILVLISVALAALAGRNYRNMSA